MKLLKICPGNRILILFLHFKSAAGVAPRAPAAAAGAPTATPGVADETEEVAGCDDDEVEIGKDVVME